MFKPGSTSDLCRVLEMYKKGCVRMLYDLQGEGNMSTIVGMLYGAVRENSERLKSITEGMSQEEVDYKGPGGHYNSAAQLIKHITYVDLNGFIGSKEWRCLRR